jgi:hypothetical protein
MINIQLAGAYISKNMTNLRECILGVIIFSSVWFLPTKLTKPKFFIKKKPKPNGLSDGLVIDVNIV